MHLTLRPSHSEMSLRTQESSAEAGRSCFNLTSTGAPPSGLPAISPQVGRFSGCLVSHPLQAVQVKARQRSGQSPHLGGDARQGRGGCSGAGLNSVTVHLTPPALLPSREVWIPGSASPPLCGARLHGLMVWRVRRGGPKGRLEGRAKPFDTPLAFPPQQRKLSPSTRSDNFGHRRRAIPCIPAPPVLAAGAGSAAGFGAGLDCRRAAGSSGAAVCEREARCAHARQL